jgi:hypothetical protein
MDATSFESTLQPPSQASPVPSLSPSAWSALGVLGQLSMSPQTPSPSTSLSESLGQIEVRDNVLGIELVQRVDFPKIGGIELKRLE